MMRQIRINQGFTLITTLFLLVVVSSLAAYLVAMSVSQQSGSALTVSMLRGRHAALSGMEWAAYRIANVADTCPTVPTLMTIEGFRVTLTACSQTVVTEGTGSYNLYDLTVRAEHGAFGDADYVNLSVRANLSG